MQPSQNLDDIVSWILGTVIVLLALLNIFVWATLFGPIEIPFQNGFWQRGRIRFCSYLKTDSSAQTYVPIVQKTAISVEAIAQTCEEIRQRLSVGPPGGSRGGSLRRP